MLRNSILQRTKSTVNTARSGGNNNSRHQYYYSYKYLHPTTTYPSSSAQPQQQQQITNNYNIISKCFRTTRQLSNNVFLNSSIKSSTGTGTHAGIGISSINNASSNNKTMMITTRNYIFFESNNMFFQMKQNFESGLSSLLGSNGMGSGGSSSSSSSGSSSKSRNDYNSYYRLQKGKQIMIRLKVNTKEQMKIHSSRLRKYILDSTISTSNSTNNGIISNNKNSRRYRFRQWRRNKQVHLTNYYTHKRSIIKHKTQHMWTKFRLHKASMKEWTLLYKKNAHTRYLNMKNDWAQYKYSKYAVTITEPFRKEWFTNDGYPLTARDPRTERFVNPWKSESTNGWKRLEEVWRWKKTRLYGYDMEHGLLKHQKTTRINNDETNVQENQLPLSIPMQLSPPTSSDKIKLTWVGHATMLVQLAGFTILTDPVFSKKASPLQYFSETEFFGVPRRLPPSFSIDDIPDVGVDICVISHDHYDHLDYDSVLQLAQKNLIKYFVVPLGIREWLINEAGVDSDKIIELEWWQSVKFRNNSGRNYFSQRNKIRLDEVTKPFEWRPSNSSIMEDSLQSLLYIENNADSNLPPNRDEKENEIVLTCAPTQHWASRTPFDRNTRLWCSWAVHASTGFDKKDLSFYFSGDTGYPSFPLFRQIGDYLGEDTCNNLVYISSCTKY